MMSRARFNAIYTGMTSVAQKVYDVVPISEKWSTSRIVAELRRLGVSVDYQVLAGCLNTLIRAGLVCEPSKGEFRRERIRECVPASEQEGRVEPMANKPEQKTAKPQVELPLDRLGTLAQRAAQLAGMVHELANEISNTAVDIQLQMEASDDQLTKLKQLQALLKSIGN